MDKRSFSQSIMISIVTGGVVVALYGIIETTSKFWLGAIPFEAYLSDVKAAMYAGLFVMVFGVVYGVFALRKKFDSIELVWQKNRESVIWYSLSTIDNDFIFMKSAFAHLETLNIDLTQEMLHVQIGNTNLINHLSIQGQIERLPSFSNALGFMTHTQFMAITDYLGYGVAFLRGLEQGFYQRDFLLLREEKARKILELFPNEEKRHSGLDEWKKHFESPVITP